MKTIKPTDGVRLTYTLFDGEDNLFVRARFFELQNGTPIQINNSFFVNLTHIQGGTYITTTWGSPTLAVGRYLIQYSVYTDATYSTLSKKYGVTEEDLLVTNFEANIINSIQSFITANCLLANDTRLNNLGTIPSLATTAQLTTKTTEVIDTLTDIIDLGDGEAT